MEQMSEPQEITENAVITGTLLGQEDHGITTAFVYFKFAGGGCGFGGYAMDIYDPGLKRRVGHRFGMDFIMEVLATVGCDTWEDLKGKHVRVVHTGWGGRILRIGNIIEDKWFDPKALAERLRCDEAAAAAAGAAAASRQGVAPSH